MPIGRPTNDQTLLVISVMGVPFYSARGLTQVLNPIDACKGSTVLRRSINGVLLDMTDPNFYKVNTKISCTDMRSPALNGIFPGMAVTIDCVVDLSYPSGGSPWYPVVPGSDYTEEGYEFYRPRIAMLITDFQTGYDEWPASASWELHAEEV